MELSPVTDIDVCQLLADITALRATIVEQGARIFRGFEPYIVRENYRSSARNLAHYLAFRHHNLRQLQLTLMALGFTSLGRIESNVLYTLSAIERILQSLCHGTPFTPPHEALAHRTRLPEETEAVFGPPPLGRSVHIMVTLDTKAGDDPSFVDGLLMRGMDCARINCAHDDAAVWRRMVQNIRRAEAARGRTCRIYMDLSGPKIRTEAIGFDKKHRFYVGDTLLLTREAPRASKRYPYQITCGVPQALDQVEVGHAVWFDDGKIGARVIEKIPRGLVLAIEKAPQEGARIRRHKGINFPDSKLSIAPLTDKDLCDLDFIAEHADMVGYSFVQTADDISLLQSELEKRIKRAGGLQSIAIIAKIETRQAVSNLPDLIVRGAGRQPFGVMLARGDLAVEIGFERLAEMQEEILWICEAGQVPVIWATQVLESATKSGVLSRAEITDAASGIKAECVMLNKGAYVADAMGILHDVLTRMSGHQYKKFNVLRALNSWERYVQE